MHKCKKKNKSLKQFRNVMFICFPHTPLFFCFFFIFIYKFVDAIFVTHFTMCHKWVPDYICQSVYTRRKTVDTIRLSEIEFALSTCRQKNVIWGLWLQCNMLVCWGKFTTKCRLIYAPQITEAWRQQTKVRCVCSVLDKRLVRYCF